MDVFKILCRRFSSEFVILVIACLASDARGAQRVSEGDVRLVGGSGPYEGTVLIRHNSKWGAICDSYWDIRDGKVVCHQLGFPGVETVSKRSKYGSGRGLIWLSRMRCRGDEDRLSRCYNDGWAYHNCYGVSRSAGVKCKQNKPSTLASTSTTKPPASPAKQAAPTTAVIATTTTQANGTTSSKLPENFGNISVVSEADFYNITELMGQLVADAPILGGEAVKKRDLPKELEIRLTNGRFPEEGRLEVRLNDDKEWGVVCGDDWRMLEAMVVCKELGLAYAKQPTQVNYYGGDDMDKVFRSVRCGGKEDRLFDCQITMDGSEEPCSKAASVAGVICTTELPDLIPNVTVLQKSAYLQDQHLYYLQCAMEEKCLSQSAYELRKTNKWINAVRRLFRFSSIVHNRGNADFRPNEPKESWEWHDCHMHYHSMNVFTHYDIVDFHGNRVAEGHKASFCLEDSDCDIGVAPKFRCLGFADQGISPGCSDNYLAAIDCQWIDVTDLKPGGYIFRLVVNPTFYVAESRYDNNAIACDFEFTGLSATITNCTIDPTVITYSNP